MNKSTIRGLMSYILIITVVLSSILIIFSFTIKWYPVPYSSPNNYEILYEGEITNITYWNVTLEMVYTNYLNYEIRNYTYNLCNFTILNGTSNKELNLTTYAYYFKDKVEIGDTIIFYHYYGSIQDFKVIKKEDN